MNEQEQNELLEAALRLIDALRNEPQAVLYGKCKDDIATIEAHRPKPKLVDGWYAVIDQVVQDGPFKSLEEARRCSEPAERPAHLREVTDPPKWERWDKRTVADIYFNTEIESGPAQWDLIADAHNAEMERFEKAWKGGE
jgi:hypothetical protein